MGIQVAEYFLSENTDPSLFFKKPELDSDSRTDYAT